MITKNIDIVRALDQIRGNSLFVHNDVLEKAAFSTEKLKGRKVYLIETLTVLNALVERGTMLLYGGHGGGKTTLTKYLGQMFCHLSKDDIENCILRGHPQLTEEKILGSLDFAQLTGAKPLTDGDIDVVWNDFVDSEWKIIDEVNRLSPYAQNILLSLLAESTVKYHNRTKRINAFTLYATMNPKDEGNWSLSLPFLDRFALALPVTMPDYDSFSTIGEKDRSLRKDALERFLPEMQLDDLQKRVGSMPYSKDAELFINFLIASYRLCMRASKESNDKMSVDNQLCEGCHMKTPQKVCSKIKQPLSVRVKIDLYRYGKALAWFLGDTQVEVKHIMAIAPYVIWHRTVISKIFVDELMSQWMKSGNGDKYVTNINLEATRKIIDMVYDEFTGVKTYLADFEEIKKGAVSEDDFNRLLAKAKNPNNNFLIIKKEIVPILENQYRMAYGGIVDYKKKIDGTSEIKKLRELKEELMFCYDIPNRQFLTDRIDDKIKRAQVKECKFTLPEDIVKSNDELCEIIAFRCGGFPEQDVAKLKTIRLKDIADDDCDLTIYRMNKGYKFTFKGDENSSIYTLLKSLNQND